MKQIFLRLLTLSLVFLMVVLPASAELSGVYLWPEDATEDTAQYVYRYSYPSFDDGSDLSEMINGYYRYLVEDAYAFYIPMAVDELDPLSDIQANTTIVSQETFRSSDYVSFLITTSSIRGAAASTSLTGHTFSLTGAKAGTVTSLPYLLGILAMDEQDTWLQERQTAKADACVRTLVWDVIQSRIAQGYTGYYDDLTFETLEFCFYPEEDFYLDENGNFVFFLQESILGPASEGVHLFPFSLDELLDEI